MNKTILAGYLSLLAITPVFVHAGPIIRSGDAVSVDTAQTLKGDFYGLASKVTISGPAEDDAYIAGGTVTVTAPVAKDLTILGGVVQIHGNIGDDLRVVGGEVTLGAVDVTGDIAVLGGTLTILSGATIKGDILFMGGDLVVEGDVTGTIHGASENVRINGKVGGDIEYTSTKVFSLGDKAQVLGSIQYKSYEDIDRAQNAHVAGDVQKIKVSPQSSKDIFKVYLFFISMLLFSALGFFLMARRYVTTLVHTVQQNSGVSGLVGLGVFLVLPFVSTLLLVSAVGILGGITVLFAYVLLLLASIGLAGIVVGYYIQKLATKKTEITLVTVCSGVVIFSLLALVPYIGGFIMFGSVMMTLGALSLKIYHKLRV
jgi:hypothetical protein